MYMDAIWCNWGMGELEKTWNNRKIGTLFRGVRWDLVFSFITIFSPSRDFC